MELKTIEDEEMKDNECKLNFHFFFELIKKDVENSDFTKFDWDVNHHPR